MPEENVRAFVAVEFPGAVKASLGKIESELNDRINSALGIQAASKALKWVDPEEVHLTLKFLGSIAVLQISDIEEALRRAAANKSPLAIELSGLGAFPNPQRPRVLWIGVHGDIDELANLQSDVDSELAALGFPREDRPFNPHITLARLRETAGTDEKKKIGEVVKAGIRTPPMKVRVDAISLMRSELTRTGARYTRIARIQFHSTG